MDPRIIGLPIVPVGKCTIPGHERTGTMDLPTSTFRDVVRWFWVERDAITLRSWSRSWSAVIGSGGEVPVAWECE